MYKTVQDGHFRHIILFKIRDNVDNEKIDAAVHLLKQLGEGNEDILEWEVEKSLDSRKGIVIVENSLFTNKGALDAFSSSEKHKKVGEFMKQISDWLIGDYV